MHWSATRVPCDAEIKSRKNSLPNRIVGEIIFVIEISDSYDDARDENESDDGNPKVSSERFERHLQFREKRILHSSMFHDQVEVIVANRYRKG